MLDLKKALEKDGKYKEILAACTEEERVYIEKYISEYLSSWQTSLFDPLGKILGDKDMSKAMGAELRKVKKG